MITTIVQESVWTAIGVTPQTVVFTIFCFAGAFLRVLATHGWCALRTRKIVGDAIGSGASSVILPWLIPPVVIEHVPTIVIGMTLLGITYATNDLVINIITKRWNLQGGQTPPEQGGKP